MTDEKTNNLTNPDIWIRLVYMILFGIFTSIARLVITVIAVVQFFLVLFTGDDNVNLRNAGQTIAKWTLQAYHFLTFNSEDKPYPFADWPQVDTEAEEDNAETRDAVIPVLTEAQNEVEPSADDDTENAKP